MLFDVPAALAVEMLATAANLAFIVLLIREKIACWAFGIAGSLLSVWLFVHVHLYSEALLYSFYAVMGVWGWLRWAGCRRRLRPGGAGRLGWSMSART